VSLHPSVHEGKPAFQLRGMAVEPAYQGLGVGRAIIEAAEEQTRQVGIGVLWANCRTPAVPFYERMGWKKISDEFEVEMAGPHFKMVHWLMGP
jgi:GNAT superfamily N-acetyltransferase